MKGKFILLLVLLGTATLSYGQEPSLRLIVKEVNVLNLESESFKEILFQLVGPMSAAKLQSVHTWGDLDMLDDVWMKEVDTNIFNGYFRAKLSVKLIDILNMLAHSGVTEIERKGEVITITEAQERALERSER